MPLKIKTATAEAIAVLMVEVTGLEPTTSWSRTRVMSKIIRDNQRFFGFLVPNQSPKSKQFYKKNDPNCPNIFVV